MLAALGPLSASLGLVSNAKKAVDVFKEMSQDVPDEGFLLWRLLDATSVPLELSTQLATRHATMPYIEAAVAITRRTIARCEQLLERGEEEADDRADGGESWASWFSQKKGGVERRVLVPQLCQNLQMCQQALQLGLSAIQVEFSGCITCPPFRLLPEVVDTARVLIESFEMQRCSRRLLFNADIWEHAASATRKAGADWCSRGLAQVWLKLQDDMLCLEMISLEQLLEESSEPEGSGVGALAAGVKALGLQSKQQINIEANLMLVLNDDIVFERGTLGAIVGAEMCGDARDASSLAYKVSGSASAGGGSNAVSPRSRESALRFIPACEGISAEMVEVLVQFCAMKQGSLDKPPLAAVFDADQVAMDGLRESLRMRTGPYEEDEPLCAGGISTPGRARTATPLANTRR